jgi:hypothetical protein
MVDISITDQRFGDIAIEMTLLSTEKLDRAFVVQRCIQKRIKVQLPIGKALKEMGLLSQDHLETILIAKEGTAPYQSSASRRS